MPVRVLLADGRPLVRAGLRLIVESDAQTSVVGEAAEVRTALAAVRQLLPDVVVADAELPGGGGAVLSREVRQWAADSGQTVQVVVVASSVAEGTAFEVLQAGARGLLLRDSSPEELVRAVREVARGNAALCPQVTARLLDRLAALPAAPQASGPAAEVARLTRREREVLRLLGRGLTNAEIARQLVLGETTVKTHVGRVLAKLGLRDRVQAVVYAYEHGLVVPGEGAGDGRSSRGE
ncbi:response regulator transcription factor [Thermobifida fusca]|uniref:LuxR C-terminal-related transcriptional regulator n=1 Tax=Thermobifida fusca TaxID=2021 RepID=UPI000D1A7538|nr:response regulator transcription factor [Thermobifida fusca]MDD6793618.1 response regulator transcription factor [Thermobifida fusca]